MYMKGCMKKQSKSNFNSRKLFWTKWTRKTKPIRSNWDNSNSDTKNCIQVNDSIIFAKISKRTKNCNIRKLRKKKKRKKWRNLPSSQLLTQTQDKYLNKCIMKFSLIRKRKMNIPNSRNHKMNLIHSALSNLKSVKCKFILKLR